MERVPVRSARHFIRCLTLGLCAAVVWMPVATATPTTPRRGGTIVIAFATEPKNLMPYGATSTDASEVLGTVFNMLAQTDSDFAGCSPSVAESWEPSADGLELVMHLRAGVLWSDGVPLTAEDVRFTYEVQTDSTVNWSARASFKSMLSGCDVLDPRTVRFRFKERDPAALHHAKEGYLLPKHIYGAVPRHEWEKGDRARHPVGCGPYRFERWEAGQRIVLVRNEHYWEPGKPYADRLVFQFVPEAATRLAQFRAGQVDYINDLPRREAAAMQEQKRTPFTIRSVRGRAYEYIGYNQRDSLFADRRVREALTRAIDRPSIIRGLCYGFAEPFESPIVPIVWAYDPQPLTPYDPEGAKRLLAAAGWRDTDGDGWLDRRGKRFEFEFLVGGGGDLRKAVAVPIQANWKAIGVLANLTFRDSEPARAARSAGKYAAALGGWNANTSANLTAVWCCNQRLNYIGFCNARIDSLNAAGLRLGPAEARPLWQEAQRIIAAEYPYTWLFYEHTVVGQSARLHGVRLDARGWIQNPEDWWVDGVR